MRRPYHRLPFDIKLRFVLAELFHLTGAISLLDISVELEGSEMQCI